ncbi:MAG: bifunctional folylpolyglutamate synthase/dihydrofolate synthase [Acidobacteria bacterium]|nr:bifunctional folylpolyglutamate synthase/dihydrofolate synthase [Acidobacteriota bacterium]
MTYHETLDYLYALGHEVLAMKLGLENITHLLAALGNPHRTCRTVHVAGTNGKGSTCAMLASILQTAGLRVGLYTSPHLERIEERIQINRQLIETNEFTRYIKEVRNTAERLLTAGKLQARPTFFEHVTAAAFLYFHHQKPDVVVLETGLGGRLDATNVVSPELAIITNIGHDHQQYLGDTLEAIAGEKAGIIKPDTPVLVAGTQPVEAAAVIRNQATAVKASLEWVSPLPILGRTATGELLVKVGQEIACLPWRASVQAQNAALAVAAAKRLLPKTPEREQHLMNGIQHTFWPGRTEWYEGTPPMLLDGAHNLESMAALAECLETGVKNRPITLVFAAMRDKPAEDLLKLLAPHVAKIVCVPVSGNPRTYSPDELAQAARTYWREYAIYTDVCIASGLQRAHGLTPPTGLVLVTGSLYLVGEVMAQQAEGQG